VLDRLTLDQLRTFIAVADTGSFSAAGRKLQRVQSAVSQTIQHLESTLDVALFDRSEKTPRLTDAGRVMLTDARHLVGGAERLRARASTIAAKVEPELTIAVDAIFPNAFLVESLRALTQEFPHLPVTVFTEGLGGAEQRLHDGAARLGLYAPIPQRTVDFETAFLADIDMAPVVATTHPLAEAPEPIARDVLEEQVQLVLTDRTQVTAGFTGGVISRRVWRFADLGTRLDYLLAGFGWCNMPLHMVAPHIAAGRLKRMHLEERNSWSLPVHVVHARAHPPGRAGQWLIADLRKRLVGCPKNSRVGTQRKRR